MKTYTPSVAALLLTILFAASSTAQSAYFVNNLTAGEYKNIEVGMTYATYEEMLADLEKQRHEKGWGDRRFNNRKSRLPEGGSLNIDIEAKTETHANTDHIRVVITDMEGNILHKEVMDNSNPKKSGKFWTSGRSVLLRRGTMPHKIRGEGNTQHSQVRIRLHCGEGDLTGTDDVFDSPNSFDRRYVAIRSEDRQPDRVSLALRSLAKR